MNEQIRIYNQNIAGRKLVCYVENTNDTTVFTRDDIPLMKARLRKYALQKVKNNNEAYEVRVAMAVVKYYEGKIKNIRII